MGTLENNEELGITERLSNIVRGQLVQDSPYSTIEVDGELMETIDQELEKLKHDEGTLFRLRPSKENNSINAAVSAWRALHDPDVERWKGMFVRNVSPEFSHELWYDDGFIRFHSYQPTQHLADRFESKLRAKYPNVDIQRPSKRIPTINQGDHISCATVHTEREFWYPIKSPLTEGGDDNPVGNEDPYSDIATSMILENDQHDGERLQPDELRAMVQIVAEPARPCWTKDCLWGKNLRSVASSLKKKDIEINKFTGKKREIPPSKQDKKAAQIIGKQRDVKGFYVTVRVFTISPHPDLAEERCRDIAEDYRKYFESFTLQGLAPDPQPQEGIREHFTDSLTRSHEFTTFDRIARFNPRKFLITAHGFGSLAHLPNEDIQAPGVDWATMDTGPGAPADTDQAEDDIEIERPERGDSAEDDKPRKQDKGSSDTSDGRREEFTR
jgi:hypothetical protein